jgi:hypothetical protein
MRYWHGVSFAAENTTPVAAAPPERGKKSALEFCVSPIVCGKDKK